MIYGVKRHKKESGFVKWLKRIFKKSVRLEPVRIYVRG